MKILEYTNTLIEELTKMIGTPARPKSLSVRKPRKPYMGPKPRGSIRAMVWTHNKNAAKDRRILQAKVQRKAMSNRIKNRIDQIKDN